MRGLALLLALVALAAPALAQTLAEPLEGKYHEVYVVAGRVVDTDGLPASGATILIDLEQEGVKAPTLRAVANCKGDFITSFTLRHVQDGKARMTLLGPDGQPNATSIVDLDPFYRRSDAILKMGGPWGSVCKQEANVWPVSASVSVRLLNRTEAYEQDGEAYYAIPYGGVVRMRYETPDGNTVCPPHPQDQTPGACEIFQADERGDIRYTFTLDQPFEAGGRVELLLQNGDSVDVSIDPASRLGVEYFEVSGQGPPAELYESPGVGVFALLASLAIIGVARRR